MEKNYKILDNYIMDLSHPIGNGATSKVYLAKSIKTNKYFAVKRILKQNQNEKVFEKEIKHLSELSKINSANIIKIEQYFISTNYYNIFIELGDETLEDYLKKNGSLNEVQAVSFLRQLVNGVKNLQVFKLCHRDLKPNNIVIIDGQLKIIDLGYAKQFQEDILTNTQVGTFQYQDPAIKSGCSYSPQLADIYSLGIIFQQMLFNLKIPNSDQLDQMKQFRKETQDLLTHMTQHDFKKRINLQSLDKKLDDLKNILEQQGEGIEQKNQNEVKQKFENLQFQCNQTQYNNKIRINNMAQILALFKEKENWKRLKEHLRTFVLLLHKKYTKKIKNYNLEGGDITEDEIKQADREKEKCFVRLNQLIEKQQEKDPNFQIKTAKEEVQFIEKSKNFQKYYTNLLKSSIIHLRDLKKQDPKDFIQLRLRLCKEYEMDQQNNEFQQENFQNKNDTKFNCNEEMQKILELMNPTEKEEINNQMFQSL